MTDPQAAPLMPQLAASPQTLRACLAVLAITALVVGGGQIVAVMVAAAAGDWLPHTPAQVFHFSTPVIAAVYQLAFIWVLAAWASGVSRRDALGLAWPRWALWRWAGVIAGLYGVKALASIALLWLLAAPGNGGGDAGVPVDGLAPFAAIMRSSVWPMLLAGGVLAAIVEEVIYRGFLSRTLEGSRLGFLAGASVASLIWAGLHVYYPLGLQAVLFIMGLCLSWLRARSGSVLPGMAWHVVNNVVGLLAMRFMV